MWIGGSSKAAIRHTARIGTGWQAGSELPDEVGPVVAAIKAEAAARGRRIDDDHYGTGFHFRFGRSEEHTSELQSLMRISYAVFCLKKKKTSKLKHTTNMYT